MIFDWDDNKKLADIFNLNTMEAIEPIQGEQEINSKYKLVPNKEFTIRIGNRVKIPSTPSLIVKPQKKKDLYLLIILV